MINQSLATVMFSSLVALAAAVGGCTSNDAGLTELDLMGDGLDGKEDSATAGIKENTFDAFGVLNTVATLDAATLKSNVGLTAAASKRIQAAQVGRDKKFGTWDDQPFITVKLMSAVGKLTDADVIKLRDYARANNLVPTSALRGPIVDEDGVLASKLNGKMKAAGLPIFWTYMYLFSGKAGRAQQRYFSMLADRASEKDINVYVATGPGIDAETKDGKYTLCYQGAKAEVADTVSLGVDGWWSEQLGVYGSRIGTEKWVYEDTTEQDLMELMADNEKAVWNNFDIAGTKVLLASDYTDGGDSITLDTIDKCN